MTLICLGRVRDEVHRDPEHYAGFPCPACEFVCSRCGSSQKFVHGIPVRAWKLPLHPVRAWDRFWNMIGLGRL